MGILKIIFTFIISCVIGAFCLLVILAAHDGVNFRSLRGYAILSGSMEPQLPLGSLVFVRPLTEYSTGDIITYNTEPDNKIPVTHRIIKVSVSNDGNAASYETRGDANNAIDPETVRQNQVIGKVFLTIPYVGYLSQAAKTQKGFIFLVVIPATIIMYEELKTLVKEIFSRIKVKKKPEAVKSVKQETSYYKLALAIIISIIITGFSYTFISKSFFWDTEQASLNTFTAGIWNTPTIILTPTPTSVPAVCIDYCQTISLSAIGCTQNMEKCGRLGGTAGDKIDFCQPPDNFCCCQ